MKKLFAFIAAFMLAGALLVSAGCGAPSPSEKVNNAIANSVDIQSAHVDFDLDLEIRGDLSSLGEGLPESIDISLVGGADFDQKGETPKARGNAEITGIEELIGPLAESADPEEQMGAALISGILSDIEFVLVDNRTYIRIAGTWYDAGESTSLDLGQLDPGSLSENEQCFKDAMKDPDRFGAEQLFSNLQEIGEEDVDGTGTRHYRADIDLVKALEAEAQIARDCGEAETAGGIEAGVGQIQEFLRMLQMDMWIDGDDNFRKIRLVAELDPEALGDITGALSGDASGESAASGLEALNVTMELRLSQFGEDFEITRPEGEIMSLEDLLDMSGLGGGLGLGGLGGSSGIEGLEGLEDLGGTSTTGTGTSTTGNGTGSLYSR